MIREYTVLNLHQAMLTATNNGTEVDLAPYIHVGHREIKARLDVVPTSDNSTATLDYKLQECATTVSTDFADITGATFTQVGDSATGETIHFQASLRYVRGVATLAGTSFYATVCNLFVLARATT